MKSLLLMICFTGLLYCENITKREGETVLLRVTEPQTLMSYVCMYGPNTTVLAVVTNNIPTVVNGTKFSSRLDVDISSGSMTISSLTIGDSGTFQIQIFRETGIERKGYNLTVTGNGISRPALEGSNVTLSSTVTQLDSEHHHVVWTQDEFDGKQIVTWEKNIVTYYDTEMREHLLLDNQTGSLTIQNITQQLSKCYCLRMMFGKDPHIMMIYAVVVYRKVSTLHLSTEDSSLSPVPRSCRVNCSVNNSDDATLTLYKGNIVISTISDPNLASPLTLTLDIPQNSSRDTFTCEAENPISKKTVVFNTTYWCPKHEEDSQIKPWTIAVGCAVTLIGIVTVIGLSTAVRKKYCCQRPNNCIALEPMNCTSQASERDDLMGDTNAAISS